MEHSSSINNATATRRMTRAQRGKITDDIFDDDFTDLPDASTTRGHFVDPDFDEVVEYEPNEFIRRNLDDWNNRFNSFYDEEYDPEYDENGDAEYEMIPDEFYNDVPNSIFFPLQIPSPEPRGFLNLPPEIQSRIIAFAISDHPDEDGWDEDYLDDDTGYDGSDMPQQLQITICNKKTAGIIASVSMMMLSHVILVCKKRITEMEWTLRDIEGNPPKETIKEDLSCEYFMMEKRLAGKGVDPDCIWPEDWPEENYWKCDHCASYKFYWHELDKYESNLSALKAEMLKLPKCIIGFEAIYDWVEQRLAVQESLEDWDADYAKRSARSFRTWRVILPPKTSTSFGAKKKLECEFYMPRSKRVLSWQKSVIWKYQKERPGKSAPTKQHGRKVPPHRL